MESIESIAERARGGDKQAQKLLFDRLFVRFRFVAKRYVGEPANEDVAQEACVTVFDKLKDVDLDRNFKGWAFTVLRNKIGNQLKSIKVHGSRQQTYDEAVSPGNPGIPDPGLRMSIEECLKMIARGFDRYAQALILQYRGFSTEEICQELRVTRNNFYVILNRGRRMLKECLEQGDDK